MTEIKNTEDQYEARMSWLSAGYGAGGLIVATALADRLMFHDTLPVVTPKFIIGALMIGAAEIYRRRTTYMIQGSNL